MKATDVTQKSSSISRQLFDKMLQRIHTGQWPVGKSIPGERVLMTEFGVSRISVRETLSMLRALGILDTSHGRRSVVRKMNAEIVGRLFPLLLTLEGEQTYEHVFEVRLAIESRTAYMAALNRSQDDVAELSQLLELLRKQTQETLEDSVKTDLRFHIRIAQATGNPIFPLLLDALGGFVTYVQELSCRGNPDRRTRAMQYHEAIFEAIRDQDAEHARGEMESHLRSSAGRFLSEGLIKAARATPLTG
ncbi:MAG: FadR family transcriptional regulator [Sedimentisphaerales bacterium]|nr:FadR family transcriptional regulator [Sedimentisphaerales bacterium]